MAHTSSTFQQKPGEHCWVGFGGISETALTCRTLSQDMGFNNLARTAENRANSLLGYGIPQCRSGIDMLTPH